MTPEQKALVRSSYADLTADSEALAAAFYGRLFELDPSLRRLFHIDMTRQGRKFTDMMQSALDCMDRLDNLIPILWPMGKRHGGYGVQSSHYATVRTALLEAIEQQSGGRLTPETLAAWQILYDLIAAAMEQAASEGAVPRPTPPPDED